MSSPVRETLFADVEQIPLEGSSPSHQENGVKGLGMFPSLVTDYLDTLLVEVTQVEAFEVIEQALADFVCLHFALAGNAFLVPCSRIERIERAQLTRLRFALHIPDPRSGQTSKPCSDRRYMLKVRNDLGWVFVDELLGLVTVQSIDVLWRSQAKRAPWFIGTHKTHLCRVFDPERLTENQNN